MDIGLVEAQNLVGVIKLTFSDQAFVRLMNGIRELVYNVSKPRPKFQPELRSIRSSPAV